MVTTYSVEPFGLKFNVVRDDGRIMCTVIGNVPASFVAASLNKKEQQTEEIARLREALKMADWRLNIYGCPPESDTRKMISDALDINENK